MNQLRFLFLYSNLKLGGVQTLILRMSQWLHEHGHVVELVVWDASDGSLLKRIREYATVHVMNLRCYQLLQVPGFAALKFRNSGFDVVHAFDPSAMWIAVQLSRDLPVRPFVGVYHPEAYQFRVYENDRTHLLDYERLFSALPDCAFLFMNDGTRKAHAKYYARDFHEAPLLPLPIIRPSNSLLKTRVPLKDPLRIVSVGRFVDFKSYPIGIMDAVARLRDTGVNVEYDLYGYGPLEAEFRDYAACCNYSFVNFRGVVPYEQLSKAMINAYAFAGMGTSLLESAALGIPSIAMKLYSRDGTCYGYLSQQIGYNAGEDGEECPVFHLLFQLCNALEDTYVELCEAEQAAAEKFTIDTVMTKYLNYAGRVCSFPREGTIPSAVSMLWKTLWHRHVSHRFRSHSRYSASS